MVALYSKDIENVVDYLGLRSRPDGRMDYHALRSLGAAFVGHGCEDDDASRMVLAVEIAKESLSVECDTSSRGSHAYLPGRVVTDFGAGRRWDRVQGYRHRVAMDIRGAIKRSLKTRVDVVIVMGENKCADNTFVDVVVNVAREFGEPELLTGDALIVASKEAAQLA